MPRKKKAAKPAPADDPRKDKPESGLDNAQCLADPAVPTHDSHDCPDCGTEQLWCYTGSTDEAHTHRCPKCGKVWKHNPTEGLTINELFDVFMGMFG